MELKITSKGCKTPVSPFRCDTCDNNCDDPVSKEMGYEDKPENTMCFCELPDECMGRWVFPLTTRYRGCIQHSLFPKSLKESTEQ